MNTSSNLRSVIVFNADGVLGESICLDMLMNEESRQHVGKVWATVRDISHPGALPAAGASLIEMGDSPDERHLTEYLRQVHCAVIVPDCGSRNMVQQAKLIVKCCAEAKVEQVVLLSRAGIEDKDTKLSERYCEVERCLKDAKLNGSCCIRIVCIQQSLFMFRRMLDQSKLQWPLQEDARFTMINLYDVVNFVRNEVLGQEGMRRRSGDMELFRLSGPHIITPKMLVELMRNEVDKSIKYEKVDRRRMQEYLKNDIGLNDTLVEEFLDEFELISKGKLNFVSDDAQNKTGKKPTDVEHFLKEHRNMFKKTPRRM